MKPLLTCPITGLVVRGGAGARLVTINYRVTLPWPIYDETAVFIASFEIFTVIGVISILSL